MKALAKMNVLGRLIYRLCGGIEPPAKLVIVRADSLDLSLDSWRGTEQLVAEWAKIESLPIYRAMLQTMRNESPINFYTEALTADEKIKRLGILEGYQFALNNLEVFGKLVQPQVAIEATFEKPESDEPQPQE